MKPPTFRFLISISVILGLAMPAAPARASGAPGSSAQILLVQSGHACRGLHGPRRGRCESEQRRRHDRHDDRKLKSGVALGIFGLAVGAMLAGAAKDAEARRQGEMDEREAWIARCSARYPSFDPRSGTFIAGDGFRYRCR